MLNYIEVFKDDYTAVFWTDAGSKDRLEADYSGFTIFFFAQVEMMLKSAHVSLRYGNGASASLGDTCSSWTALTV